MYSVGEYSANELGEDGTFAMVSGIQAAHATTHVLAGNFMRRGGIVRWSGYDDVVVW